MAKHVLKNVRLFTGGCDLTSVANKIEMPAEYEEKDVTTFGSVDASGDLWKEVLGGLAAGQINASGFWEAFDLSKVDDTLWAQLATAAPWTIAPLSANAADPAYLTNAVDTSYQLLGSPGDVAPWQAAAKSTWGIARGKVLHPPGTARTATGTGTIVDLGAGVAAGKNLYATLHVLSASGTTPSLTVAVQTAAAVGFASPTTRLTFTAATALGGQIMRVAGPITDQYARVSFTISGTTPSFLFVVAVGVA